VQKRFAHSTQTFNYARDYSDWLFTTLGKGRNRRATTFNALTEHRGAVSVDFMMDTLRHHNDEHFDPQSSITNMDVCMHAGFGPIRGSQSTASMVVYLDRDTPIIFATGTSAPCTSIFKPFWMDAASSLSLGPAPTHRSDSSLYWTHETLHRATLLNYPERIATYAADRDQMEQRFTRSALQMHNTSPKERADFTAQCLAESLAAEAEWLERVEAVPAKKRLLHSYAWNRFNKQAAMKV
jgi:dipeptidase